MERSWGEGSSGREEGREAGREEARGPKYLKGGGGGGGQRQTLFMGGGGGSKAMEAEPSLAQAEENLGSQLQAPSRCQGNRSLRGPEEREGMTGCVW